MVDLIPLKITFGESTVRCRLAPPLTVNEIIETVRKLFPTFTRATDDNESDAESISENQHFFLKYVDDEDEIINIYTNDDLIEATNIYHSNTTAKRALHIIVATTPTGKIRKPTRVGSKNLTKQPFAQAILKEIRDSHHSVCEQVVSWFLKNMPSAYFNEIDEQVRFSHVKALIGLRMAGQKQEMSLVNNDKTVYTYIKPTNYIGLLSEVVSSLPKGKFIHEAHIYTARDNTLVLDVFEVEAGDHISRPKFTMATPESIALFQRVLYYLSTASNSPTSTTPFQPLSPTKLQSQVETLMGTPVAQHLQNWLLRCDLTYVHSTPAETIAKHYWLSESIRGVGTLVQFDDLGKKSKKSNIGNGIFEFDEPEFIDNDDDDDDEENPTPNTFAFTMVTKPVEYDDLFLRTVNLLSRLGVDVLKAKLTSIDSEAENVEDTSRGKITIMTCHVSVPKTSNVVDIKRRLEDDLVRLNWVDQSTLLFAEQFNLSIYEGEILTLLTHLLHCILAEEKPLLFTQFFFVKFLQQYPDIMRAIIDLFIQRLMPPTPENPTHTRVTPLSQQAESIEKLIDNSVEMEESRRFFFGCVFVIKRILKTNLFVPGRIGLGVRLDPGCLSDFDKFKDGESPFGLFFAVGRNFVGVHFRFRDIARGGMRLVKPNSDEQHSVALRGVLNECYRLAWAQQLKNKDIPEGGSKCVLVLTPDAHAFDCARAFTDMLLDLTIFVDSPLGKATVADYYGVPNELVYLGPDENVTNDMLIWINRRAVAREHPFPNTFMSSKPGGGINHKQYGVTSEGIHVFLDVALHHLGYDPKRQPFTVKLTGGPDGDLGGNQIKILHREYGSNARIVAIADGFGVAEDPEGLDHTELLRLVSSGLSIAEFNKAKLSANGVVLSTSTNQGVKARNTMCFRVISDVFIPAGGRPFTINDNNWQQFFHENNDGTTTPSAKLIVEGANIFLSPLARTNLSDRGVFIVKDSSANKGGVICSSLEILAGMLLKTEYEFLEIKEEYVKDVLERLRYLARREAETLFRDDDGGNSNDKLSLPEKSEKISKMILTISDLVEASLDEVFPDNDFNNVASNNGTNWKNELEIISIANQMLYNYCPPTLRRHPIFHRALQEVPRAYKKWLLAKTISGELIYREGLDFFDRMIRSSRAKESVGKMAIQYLKEIERVKRLVNVVAKTSDLDKDAKDQIIKLLEWGGAGSSLEMKSLCL